MTKPANRVNADGSATSYDYECLRASLEWGVTLGHTA
jgi:hypothetical protein